MRGEAVTGEKKSEKKETGGRGREKERERERGSKRVVRNRREKKS